VKQELKICKPELRSISGRWHTVYLKYMCYAPQTAMLLKNILHFFISLILIDILV